MVIAQSWRTSVAIWQPEHPLDDRPLPNLRLGRRRLLLEWPHFLEVLRRLPQACQCFRSKGGPPIC
jgi:hypothetical protein